MHRFTLITGCLVVLLTAALLWGGLFGWAALIYVTAFVAGLDRLTALETDYMPPEQEFPGSQHLLTVLGVAHIALLLGGIVVLADPVRPLADKVALYFALALFLGQVGHPCAHELIHQSSRWRRRLGVAVYCSILFGHHASAHTKVHHIHAATAQDPNTARLGEGFWRYVSRAWINSFRAGYAAEAKFINTRANPYRVYLVEMAVFALCAYFFAGPAGLFWLISLGLYAQIQVLLADYVQHYGLRRRPRADGRLEPVGPQHSWNAPQGMSSGLMLNAPRHSDHHTNPSRDYPNLRLDPSSMPMLPHALPIMAVIALWPPLWRAIMDPLAQEWAETQSSRPSYVTPAAPSGTKA